MIKHWKFIKTISGLISRKKRPGELFNNSDSTSQTEEKEPNWNALFNFGLPLNIRDSGKKKYNYNEIFQSIISASNFLIKNSNNVNYLRHYDSFKALLLTLKTHYPSKYAEIQNKSNIDFNTGFNLNNIEGKHIKLRNICLSEISDYFRRN